MVNGYLTNEEVLLLIKIIFLRTKIYFKSLTDFT